MKKSGYKNFVANFFHEVIFYLKLQIFSASKTEVQHQPISNVYKALHFFES